MIYDFIIIGASHAGLSAAALLAKQGHKVLVLEAHSKAGGCASYFKREIDDKQYSFEVGATSISGYEGEKPIAKLCNELGIEADFEALEIGMVIKIAGKTIKRYKDREKWIDEICNFCDDSFDYRKKQKAFWQEIEEIDKKAWKLLSINDSLLPPLGLGYLKYINQEIFNAVSLLPGLFLSLEHLLKKHGLEHDQKFRQLIDEILLISTQNYSNKCPYLAAAMGLAYPAEVHYPRESIAKLAQQIQSKFVDLGGEMKFREKVSAIKKTNALFEVSSDKNKYQCKQLISGIPFWNLAQLYPHKELEKRCKKFPQAWGAFCLYLALETDFNPDSAFYQIHCSQLMPHAASKSFFTSFSMNDSSRAPENQLSITISTHVDQRDWQNPEKYQNQKEELSNYIIKELKKHIPELETAKIIYKKTSSPRTFERFTSRHKGFVGGIAHSTDYSVLDLGSQRIEKDLYLIGDTSFPGQGLAATIYSAMSVVKQISEHEA